jgi:glycine dehydrogenase subunit 1
MHTDEDIRSMLATVGVGSLDELFTSIPEDCRRRGGLNLPAPMTESELSEYLGGLAADTGSGFKVYVGAGSYEHFVPASVPYLLGRSEFTTAYTPYQPEISQGTLQAIYEYQTLVSRLLGMEAANASMYDGATALAEALLMTIRVGKNRRKVAVSKAIHPAYRQVVETYFRPTDYEIVELPYDQTGRTVLDLGRVEDLAGVALQSPNFFGCVEDLSAAAQAAHAGEALLVACFSEPLAYALFKNPGSQGADVACGEGQSLGLPRSYGGPGLGMFASRMKFIRNVPGRLVGQTLDLDGNRGFVLTLATREQHIRREKAVSNICTNNSLCALTAAMYMASAGSSGLRDLALLNRDKAEYLKAGLAAKGLASPFSAPTFNEFVVKMPAGFAGTWQKLLDKKIMAGLSLAKYYPELENHYLFCATEVHSRADLDRLVEEVTS